MPNTTPEQTVAQLKATKDQIARLLKVEAGLKQEMENHYAQNSIRGRFVAKGISAVRCCKEGKWAYSEYTTRFILTKKEEIEEQMKMEREDGTAIQNEATFYWMIRESKGDS
jgi:hypothetical protein